MGDVLLRDLDQLRRQLAPHLRRARKVTLFGSVARGDADAGSDLDLIVVADTTRPFFERFKDFAGQEFAQMVAEERPLITRALEEGVILHETA